MMSPIESYEEAFEGPRNTRYVLGVQVRADEATQGIEFVIGLRANDADLCSINIQTRLVNPIIIDDVIVVAAIGFATCVARNCAVAATPLVMASYDESKKQLKTVPFLQRAKDVASRFLGKKQELMMGIGASIVGCLVLPT